MIKLEARRKYFLYSVIRWIVTILCSLPAVVYGLVCFVSSLLNKTADIIANQMLIIYFSIPAVTVNVFFIVFGGFYKKKLRHDVINEFYEIVSITQLPEKLPKVVYVYTCHGDMMPARVLQNSMQTYKNLEIWISEGSEKSDVIETSKKFAIKHGFNFYSVGGKGSSNKAENLNSFLKNVHPRYDFLLITDADEVLDEHFVDYGIRCFTNSKFNNLGYISALNYCYETTNSFCNICCNSDNSLFYTKDFTKVFQMGYKPNLYSASCLISNKLIEKNNGLFPSGNLEDVFLESISIRNGFVSVILPIAPSGQAFDKNVYKYIDRFMRVNDWSVCLAREHGYKKYNEKYTPWFNGILQKYLKPLTWILAISVVVLLSWLIWSWSNELLKNVMFLYILGVILGTTICSLLCNNIIDCTRKTSCNKFWFLWIILKPLFTISAFPNSVVHWFKSCILHKYSSFGGSNQKSKRKNPNLNKLFTSIFGVLITSILLATLILVFILKIGFNNKYYNLGFLFGVVCFGVFFLAFLSQLVLYILSLIKTNSSYNPKDFIKPRDFYKFKTINKNRQDNYEK